MNIFLKTIVFGLLFVSSAIFAQSGKTPAPSENGMVVTSHYLASKVGSDILKKGGNAIDATVATAFALAVTLPSAGNIGGGGFLVYYGDDGKKTTFNFREKAPLAASEDMFLGKDGKIKNNSNHEGLLATGVPGTVAGLYMAHQKMGKLPWSDLVAPAVKLAEEGYPASYRNEWFVHFIAKNNSKYPSTAKAFLKPDNTPYKPGEIFKQPELAETLKRIQKKGADGFYKGKTAKLIADFMKKNGGIITEKDLAKYRAQELTPVLGTYRGYEIVGMPPPSSGGIALIEMLNILEGYNLSEMGHNSAASLHVITEAMRRAFSDRAEFVGDSDFNPDLPIDKLLSKEHANNLRSSIDLQKASLSDSAHFNAKHLVPESPETTHISVVDKQGNAVSMTYTLENSYGNKYVVEGAGFLLNNEMGDFNPIPGYTNSRGLIGTKPNLVQPEKRMLSSMTPSIVAKNGKPVIVIGSPGGRTIINTVLQVILNVIDFDMNIAQAIESPRIHHQWFPNKTSFEKFGISPDTQKLYEALGHEVYFRNMQGQAMGITIDHKNNKVYGAADSRSFDARAVGY
ncbi:gamma-glutamyltransferase [Aureibaculum sp. A20]|uniref:Glutathione hydrolase proenzyme n=1 Tax=Aureibaculum flavum TaxID=2795986 RepID=A0ABS0WWL0_9FLAO|nr:gamma-glutamyltransferase [Aureibaculum flavum]MBJ2176387.1 gamma-glutamyltransferase [Aureibaculum flavum]